MKLFRLFHWLLFTWLSLWGCWAQQTHIKLEQGDLIGVSIKLIFKYVHKLNFFVFFQLKVFPDGARSAIYAFLGIPYAQAPLGSLRFAVG